MEDQASIKDALQTHSQERRVAIDPTRVEAGSPIWGMRFDLYPAEADHMDKLQQWALPASIAFAGACVLGAGVLVSMPLKGIEATAIGVVGEYGKDGGKGIKLNLRGGLNNGVHLRGGESVGQFAN